MKKIILFFILSITACDNYTIQNDYIEDVRAGYVIINSGQCLEFFDFPILGDFPLKFRYKDHQLMSGKLYKPGHYKVSKQGDILKQNKACELDPVRKKDSSKTGEDSSQIETDDLKPLDSSAEEQNKPPSPALKPKIQDKTPKQNTKEIEVISV